MLRMRARPPQQLAYSVLSNLLTLEVPAQGLVGDVHSGRSAEQPTLRDHGGQNPVEAIAQVRLRGFGHWLCSTR